MEIKKCEGYTEDLLSSSTKDMVIMILWKFKTKTSKSKTECVQAKLTKPSSSLNVAMTTDLMYIGCCVQNANVSALKYEVI